MKLRTRGTCLAALLVSAPASAADLPSPEPPPKHVRAPKPHEVANAAEDERGPPCETAFIEHVYKQTKPSVVRISRPDGSLGTGFVYHSSKHVATALHVVDLGRELRVEFPSGRTMAAVVVATDEEHDLAILELAQSTDATPLEGRTSVSVGSPILAIGNPYGDLARFSNELEGLLNFSVSQGIVSAKSDTFIQTDAVLSPGNSGGPMLTCDGKVVGVADRLLESRIGFGVPVNHLEKLAGRIGTEKYRGRWAGRDGAFGGVLLADANSYLGFYLGGSIVGYDRIALTVRLGMAWAGKQETIAPVTDRYIRRLFGEAMVGYRMLLVPYSFPMYLTVSGGVFATIDRGEETRLSISTDLPTRLVSRSTSISGGGLQPMIQAVFHLAALEASYGFALDVPQPKFSTHRVLLGLSF